MKTPKRCFHIDNIMSSDNMGVIAMSKDINTIKGVVVECLPNTMFRVQPEGTTGDENLMLTYLAGKMKLYRIRVLVGDSVEVLVDPYGGKGRITKRF